MRDRARHTVVAQCLLIFSLPGFSSPKDTTHLGRQGRHGVKAALPPCQHGLTPWGRTPSSRASLLQSPEFNSRVHFARAEGRGDSLRGRHGPGHVWEGQTAGSTREGWQCPPKFPGPWEGHSTGPGTPETLTSHSIYILIHSPDPIVLLCGSRSEGGLQVDSPQAGLALFGLYPNISRFPNFWLLKKSETLRVLVSNSLEATTNSQQVLSEVRACPTGP